MALTSEEEKQVSTKPWAENADAIVISSSVDITRGLGNAEAERRVAIHGANQLTRRAAVSTWFVLVKQFKSLIVGILAVAAVIALIFGELLESLAVGVVIVLNTAIGFITELRAVRSMEALYALGTVNTRVRRNGHVIEIPAEQLVPGDIVLVEAGDVVTADLRILECSMLQADESALTGESLPVRKHSKTLSEITPLAERSNMLYKGTSITRGSGTGIVVQTGMSTELGSISALVATAEKSATPLEQRLDRLGHKLIWMTLAIGVLVIAVGVASGQELVLMIQTGLALAVAAIPEGLPVVATIALARGMQLMARRNALINQLASVETLGATSVICVDKTGTLTENRMMVTRILAPSAMLQFKPEEGRMNWCAEDAVFNETQKSELYAALETALLCNNAELAEDQIVTGEFGPDAGSSALDQLQGSGDPLELALLLAGRQVGQDAIELKKKLPRVHEVAFSPEARLMATIHGASWGMRVAVKGAPESVLQHCTHESSEGELQPIDDVRRQHWLGMNESLAASGLRILAVAEKTVQTADEPVYENLSFQALIGLFDPPRRDIGQSITSCRDAGVEFVMITGDQAATAREVAHAVGIIANKDEEVICGSEIRPSHLLSASERQRLLDTRIFARVSPAQKLDLIALHQEQGHTIAMTGDGVNDAPALRKADIGIAMGQRGTQVAREAADMILKDDSFSTIVLAIKQGRIIFNNIRVFVFYLMSCNVSEVMVVGLAAFLGTQLPVLPLQILFLNLVTDVFPALALGFGAGERDVMKRPPRLPGESILTGQHWLRIALYGVSFIVAVLGALYIAQEKMGSNPKEAVTISFLTLAFAQLWHVFNMRSDEAHPLFNSITRNHWVWLALALCTVLLLVAVYAPPVALVLDISRPDLNGWLLIIGMSLIPLLFGQLMKRVARSLETIHGKSKRRIRRAAA